MGFFNAASRLVLSCAPILSRGIEFDDTQTKQNYVTHANYYLRHRRTHGHWTIVGFGLKMIRLGQFLGTSNIYKYGWDGSRGPQCKKSGLHIGPANDKVSTFPPARTHGFLTYLPAFCQQSSSSGPPYMRLLTYTHMMAPLCLV